MSSGGHGVEDLRLVGRVDAEEEVVAVGARHVLERLDALGRREHRPAVTELFGREALVHAGPPTGCGRADEGRVAPSRASSGERRALNGKPESTLERACAYTARMLRKLAVLLLASSVTNCAPPWLLVSVRDSHGSLLECEKQNDYVIQSVLPNSPRFRDRASCQASPEFLKAEDERKNRMVYAVAEDSKADTFDGRFRCGNVRGRGDINVGENGRPRPGLTFRAEFTGSRWKECHALARELRALYIETWIEEHPDASRFANAFRNRQIARGMSEAQVRLVNGWPARTERFSTPDRRVVRWHYHDASLDFEEGVLVDFVIRR